MASASNTQNVRIGKSTIIQILIRALCVSALLLSCSVGLLPAEDKPATKPVKSLILPGESFLLDGRPAFILWPQEDKRLEPQPWIMYAPTLPGLPDRHEKWMHEQFIAAGVAVAGIDIGEAYGSLAGQKHFTALYRELTEKRGFATKVCLLGRSRGGLWVSSWAIQDTDKVAGIAGIYPVFDLRSYPGLNRAAPAYGLEPQEFIRKAVSPIYTNKVGHTYGYFWWGSEMEISGKKHRCISARGAGGQFIFILPTLDLIVVVTSHNKEKAMRYPFDLLKGAVLPAFASE